MNGLYEYEMWLTLDERKNNRNSTNGCGFVFAAAQMMNRKKTIEYNNDTSIEQRTTVNLTRLCVLKTFQQSSIGIPYVPSLINQINYGLVEIIKLKLASWLVIYGRHYLACRRSVIAWINDCVCQTIHDCAHEMPRINDWAKKLVEMVVD